AFGAHNEPYAHLFGCLERTCDDIAGHCHTIAGHPPGGFQGLRDRTAHKIDNLCLNLIETVETLHDPLFDRGASAADDTVPPWVVACFFCHLTPPVACSPLPGKRAREPLATVFSEVSAYCTLSLREGMDTLSSLLTGKTRII